MKNILFVCVENACRSQMAEAWARSLGGERVRAYSAGSRPGEDVHPLAREVMRERGLDLSGHAPKGLQDLPDVLWDVVVTMGCGDECPAVPARVRLSWDIPDPKGQSIEAFRRVRDEIERRVRELVDSLNTV